MRERIRARLTYANVMATMAVFIALGGSAAASVIITSNSEVASNTISGHHPPSGKHANVIANSINGQDIASGGVGGADLGSGAVTAPKLALKAVAGSNVKNDTLTGANINESTLSPGAFRSGVAQMTTSDPPRTVVATGSLTLTLRCEAGAFADSARLVVDVTGIGAADVGAQLYGGGTGTGFATHVGSGPTAIDSNESATLSGGTFGVEAADGSFIDGHYFLKGGTGCELSANGIAG